MRNTNSRDLLSDSKFNCLMLSFDQSLTAFHTVFGKWRLLKVYLTEAFVCGTHKLIVFVMFAKEGIPERRQVYVGIVGRPYNPCK